MVWWFSAWHGVSLFVNTSLSFVVSLFVNTSVCGIVVLKSLRGGYFTGLWYVARALQRMGSWVHNLGLQCHHVVKIWAQLAE